MAPRPSLTPYPSRNERFIYTRTRRDATAQSLLYYGPRWCSFCARSGFFYTKSNVCVRCVIGEAYYSSRARRWVRQARLPVTAPERMDTKQAVADWFEARPLARMGFTPPDD